MSMMSYNSTPLSFHGFSGIPDPSIPGKTVAGVIRQWCIEEGMQAAPEQMIGIVEIAGRSYGVVICFPALIQCLYASEGSAVAPDDVILKWFNEGKNIPAYRRAYFRLVDKQGIPGFVTEKMQN